MRIPRWTTYPAFAVLMTVAFLAIPRRGDQEERGAAARARVENTPLNLLDQEAMTEIRVIEPRIDYLEAPPTDGQWRVGDIVYNTFCCYEDYLGWVCVAAGSPGHWAPFYREVR